MTPTAQDLWFLPLGGCGEIGGNMNLYGHNRRWLMVDCGIGFERRPGAEATVYMPDPSFIAARHETLAALIVTHAHEDHVGAVADLWPQLRCPVYTTAFTAAVLERKLAEVGLLGTVPVHVVEPGSRQQIDVFDIEWLNITHSTPESQSLMIRTPVGNVFHTGDWKLDSQPLVGADFSREAFQRVGDEGVLAMVCDSTNATVPGRSVSEAVVRAGLAKAIGGCEGRVVVCCFGSNIARLQSLAEVAVDTGRYIGLLGRSLHNNLSAARLSGIWSDDLSFVPQKHLGYLPRHEVLAVATGSQGEPRTALNRLAAGNHPDLDLEAGDTVLLSARVIPGNEEAFAQVTAKLEAMGVSVVVDAVQPIHASGHPAQEELKDLYGWIKPAVAIPVHGEAKHLRANAGLAKSLGVNSQLQGLNGDLFLLAPQTGVQRQKVPAGRIELRR